MTRSKHPEYTCPRCGYETPNKTYMHRHFYRNKKPCPGSVKRMELTEEVKTIVLEDRVYILRDDARAIPSMVINHTNTIINHIANLNIFDKLSKLVAYDDTETNSFEEHVEEQFKTHAHKFLNDGFRGIVEYTDNHYLDMISQVTEAKDVHNINVVYDASLGYIHFSQGGGEWERYRTRDGIKYIVETLALAYLQNYEIYLVRKLQTDTGPKQVAIGLALDTYYMFIGTFDIQPFVQGKRDVDVLFNNDDRDKAVDFYDIEAHRVVDDCCQRFGRARESLSESQKKATSKEVLDIIKQTAKVNILELNKKIFDVLNIDTAFKAEMIGLISR